MCLFIKTQYIPYLTDSNICYLTKDKDILYLAGSGSTPVSSSKTQTVNKTHLLNTLVPLVHHCYILGWHHEAI